MANASIITVNKVDVGIDTDSPTHAVAWATGRNVRFTPGYVSKTLGKTLLATLATADLPIRDEFGLIAYDGNAYTIICTDAKIYAANGDFTTITDITPTPAPTGNVNERWEFCIVAGLPILTNGKDPIWKWTSPSAVLTALTGAPVAKNISCCMHRLVCSNIYDNGFYYPNRAKWTETGRPEVWTLDTSKKAGRYDITDYENGSVAVPNIIQQITDGSKTYFFTQYNMWVCDFAQVNKSFILIDSDIRVTSPKLVCIHKGYIYVLAKDNVYRYYNGQKTAIGNPIKNNIPNFNYTYITSSFCFPMHGTNEIWFCVPTASNTSPDTAYIYNWELGNWTIQDCDFLSHSFYYGQPTASSSYVTWLNNSGAAVAWKNNSGTTIHWMGQSTLFGAIPQDICGDSKSHVLLMDSGFNALDTSLTETAIYGLIETGDMELGNRTVEKVIETLFPGFVKQTQTNKVYIQVGIRTSLSNALTWSAAYPFTMGTSKFVDLSSYKNKGNFLRLRFYTNEKDAPWSLTSFTANIKSGRKIRA